MARVHWQSTVRHGVPGLLAGLALAWVLGSGRVPTAQAQQGQHPLAGATPPVQAPSGGEAAGTIAFTSGTAGSAQWLYLIDTRSQSFAVYRVDPQNPKGTVKLEAARHYRYDLKLAEYNNQPPEVSAIESMVKAVR
jgi:hypothetical protein